MNEGAYSSWTRELLPGAPYGTQWSVPGAEEGLSKGTQENPSGTSWSRHTASYILITMRKLFMSTGIPQIFNCSFWKEGSHFLSCSSLPQRPIHCWLGVLTHTANDKLMQGRA